MHNRIAPARSPSFRCGVKPLNRVMLHKLPSEIAVNISVLLSLWVTTLLSSYSEMLVVCVNNIWGKKALMHLLFSQLLSRETQRPLVFIYRPNVDQRDRGHNWDIELCCECKSLGLVSKEVCEQGCKWCVNELQYCQINWAWLSWCSCASGWCTKESRYSHDKTDINNYI